MTDHIMLDILAILAERRNLPRDMAVRAFQVIMNGGATPAQMGAFLMGLRVKGETADELTAGAIAMRAKAQRVNVPAGAIDPCGTGGDARGTVNISTAVAFVLAACGVPVAKHGNRSVSSRSGSADVLAVLGIKIEADTPALERCIREHNLCFIHAPKFHPATRHVAPVRQELGLRTIFNLLGPLSNPAAPDFHLMGIYSRDWQEPMAHALKELGTKAAWIVHGSDGMDELTITGTSHVVELKNGTIRHFDVTPEDAGLARGSLDELRGGSPEDNARALTQALSGAENAYRRAVILNAAAGLVIAGKAADLKEGAAQATDAVDSGRAYALIQKVADASHVK
jgi:anthranilate phosphoribosyltransferase